MEALRNDKINSQALVLIHGIGEQRPMDTLRAFVNGVKSYLAKTDPSEVNTVIRSKPDAASELYETRRLMLSGSRSRPRTDFYEFYWAHNMRDTAFSNTIVWLRKLIFTRVGKIPPRLKGLWFTIWALILSIVLAAVVIFINAKLKAFFAALAAIPIVLTILGVIQKYFSNAFLTTAGDAARYFTPTPDNIKERFAIRQQGISLLKKLHERGYDRIIVVGHSLGSVIAYDLLRLLWIEYYDTFDKNLSVDQDLLPKINAFCKDPSTIENVDAFQKLQYQCWEQQRKTGNKWLVTDLITIGAAVCSADYFMVNKLSFSELAIEREFPVCPPIVDDKEKDISFRSETYEVAGTKRTVKILHHAALFAITRWTNIFFSCDFVGSAGQRIFGKGIKDVEVKRKSLWFIPGGHTHYWDEISEESLAAITKALHLRPPKKTEETAAS